MKILVTGGCGYVGSILVPRLIQIGHSVKVIDTQWFGNYLKNSKNLEVIKKSVNEIKLQDLFGIEAVVHLANIANDPSVELNPVLSWETNVLHTTQLLELSSKTQSIRKFLYASSGSVYGVKEESLVTEELSLMPISAYNKTKMSAERVCLSYQDYFNVYCIRPATVCGLSPRMRFDVVVNMFVMQAFQRGVINVFGGNQIRPNIHIEDMAEVYEHFLKRDDLQSGFYNAGFENISVLNIAEKVSEVFKAKIEIKESNDPRSYRQDSSKLIQTGFIPKKTVNDAIMEIANALKDGQLADNEMWHTVKWMNKLNLGLTN